MKDTCTGAYKIKGWRWGNAVTIESKVVRQLWSLCCTAVKRLK